MTDTEKAEYESVVGMLTAKLEEAVGEIDRLRAVVAKLTGTDDAHSTLRRMYLDEALPPTARVRAATAALNFEKPRLESVPPPLELAAEPIEPLADVVARQRARADRMLLEDPRYRDLPKVFSSRPSGDGNGQDDSGSGDAS
jgi:hypothetical protein